MIQRDDGTGPNTFQVSNWNGTGAATGIISQNGTLVELDFLSGGPSQGVWQQSVVAGQWFHYLSATDDNNATRVYQDGSILTFVDENGNVSSGYFLNATQMLAADWNNQTWSLSQNGSLAEMDLTDSSGANNGIWQRSLIAGQWFHDLGPSNNTAKTYVFQDGDAISILDDANHETPATFSDPAHLYATYWQKTWTISQDGFLSEMDLFDPNNPKPNDGTWQRAMVAGQWFHGTSNQGTLPKVHFYQDGDLMTFIDEAHDQTAATFQDPDHLFATNWNETWTFGERGSIEEAVLLNSSGSNQGTYERANIAGTWFHYNNGVYASASPHVYQDGDVVTLVDEANPPHNSGPATFINAYQLNVPNWNFTDTISQVGFMTELDLTNSQGTNEGIWQRTLLDGQWFHLQGGDATTNFYQEGDILSFRDENGNITAVSFIDPAHLNVISWNLNGALTQTGATTEFDLTNSGGTNEGSYQRSLVFGNWVDSNGVQYTIMQYGDVLIYLDANGSVVFQGSNGFSAPYTFTRAGVTGTVSSTGTQITWSDGSPTWTKLSS